MWYASFKFHWRRPGEGWWWRGSNPGCRRGGPKLESSERSSVFGQPSFLQHPRRWGLRIRDPLVLPDAVKRSEPARRLSVHVWLPVECYQWPAEAPCGRSRWQRMLSTGARRRPGVLGPNSTIEPHRWFRPRGVRQADGSRAIMPLQFAWLLLGLLASWSSGSVTQHRLPPLYWKLCSDDFPVVSLFILGFHEKFQVILFVWPSKRKSINPSIPFAPHKPETNNQILTIMELSNSTL